MNTNASRSPAAKNHNLNVYLFWAAMLMIFMVAVWFLRKALLPFLLGAGIAYLLEPVVRKLSRWKIPRHFSTLLILGSFVLFIVVLLSLSLPFAYNELKELLTRAPKYFDEFHDFAESQLAPVADRFGVNLNNFSNLAHASDPDGQPKATPMIGHALSFGGGLAAGLLSSGKAIAEILATLVFILVVAFYMMNEWPAITGWIDHMIPRRNYDTIKNLLTKIDIKLASFIRGQLLISASLSLYYGLALTIAGVSYGFLIGVGTGILSLIPYISAPFGLIASCIFAGLDGAGWVHYAVLAGIFVLGHILEGYVLTPRLMGKAVGMDPLWVMFAILAGGYLFGLPGMILAVPVAASLGVLFGFAIEQYRKSPYYKG